MRQILKRPTPEEMLEEASKWYARTTGVECNCAECLMVHLYSWLERAPVPERGEPARAHGDVA